MPIECAVGIERMEQDQFHSIDKRVMRHVFDIHNTMGRFLDEGIYQEELAQRCKKIGLDVQREVMLQVSHRDFTKRYYTDLLIESGTIYELREALLHFLDGPESGVCPVDIDVSGRIVGRQKMCLLDAQTAWHLSTVRGGLRSYETHITRLLNHTPLQRIHWINLNHRDILLKTLKK